ncbi:hypothetical protein [Herbaspirillum sp. LeCh32-8]|uniref:hypothetical protein n=1 Tax=Herbaspirillum sp. LeCh32-8 TaxID=2821356 RepID=UPI0032AF532E
MLEEIDLDIALKKLHQLQLEDGDLGAAYWLSISNLLRNTVAYHQRAVAAEEKLRKISKLCR